MRAAYLWMGVAVVLATAATAEAQQRTISGLIKDDTTGEPVPAAIVSAIGPDGQAVATVMTEADGLFVLSGVPAGEVTIEVQPPGYETKRVKAGANTTTITIAVEVSVTEVITIVERAPILVRTNLQNGASVVKGEDLNRVASQTIDDAMQAKVTGAN